MQSNRCSTRNIRRTPVRVNGWGEIRDNDTVSSPVEHTRRPRAAVLAVRDGRVLLVKHVKQGNEYWLLPGGRLEPGEAEAAAAVREVSEETGYHVELLNNSRPVAVVTSRDPSGVRYLNTIFLGQVAGRVKGWDSDPDGSVVQHEWVTWDDLLRRDFRPSVAAELRALNESGFAGRELPVILTARWVEPGGRHRDSAPDADRQRVSDGP